MTDRFKAVYSDFELSIALHGIDALGNLWFKPVAFETVDTPVTTGWFDTGIDVDPTWNGLYAYSAGTPFSQWGDLVG